MSSEIDPAKLKVVELRAELSSRGLDSKGIKAVLVKRLKDALEKELQQELPDTSIADTSTEDLNTSQDEPVVETSEKKKEKLPDPKPPSEAKDLKTIEKMELESKDEKIDVKDTVENVPVQEKEPVQEKPAIEEKPPVQEKSSVQEKPLVQDKPTDEEKPPILEKQLQQEIEMKPLEEKLISEGTSNENVSKDTVQKIPEMDEIKPETETKIEENGDKTEEHKEDEVETRNKKSRWGAEEEIVENAELKEDSDMQVDECVEKKEEKVVPDSGNEQRGGDKRRRTSTSPTRSQRRRSRSPIKEDEPTIDNDKVQLNWYDSDLHLQIDKETFLSARPYHDGAFGYVWAGVRASHGANSGKICFEVKITEELKWDDIIKHDRSRRDRERRESRRERSDKKSDSKTESEDKKKDKKSSQDSNVDKKEPEIKEESEKPEIKEEPEKPANKEEPEKPEIKEESEKPEIKEESEKPEIKEVSEKPEIKEECEKPEIKEESEKPEIKEERPKLQDETSEIKQEIKDEVECKKEDVETTKSAESNIDTDKADEKMDTSEPISDTVKDGEAMDVTESVAKEEKEISQIPTHLIRIGWSMINTSLQLGEVKYSYGYESSGKFFNDKQFSQYGRSYSVGDVIGAFVDFGVENVSIIYTINGEELPTAVTIPKSDLPENFGLFPHILSRNYVFEVNLGNREEAWFTKPESLGDYLYVSEIVDKISGPVRPESRSACEIIMMCGLPASGKTHWVQEHIKENLEKRYTVIGNTQLLEKMTVNGNPLRSNIKGRWNVVLDKLSKCLNKLVEVASLRRRNYVIDQTNVFPSAQRRKMRPFEGFKRRAVIVVCGDEEQAKRQALQEAQDGKDVADIAVLEMKANMSLPRVGDWIEEVTYVELKGEEAKAMVEKYNKQGKDAGFGPFVQRRDNRDDKRWHNNRRNDYRGGYRERNYQNIRYDRGSKHGSGWQSRSQGWSRSGDRRDNRGSSGGSRDWRNNNRGSGSRYQDRGRDRDRSSHGNRDNYTRNRSQGNSRGQGSNWQGSGGNWGGQGNWTAQGNNWQQGQSGQTGTGNWNAGWSQQQGQGKLNYNNQGYGQQGYNYPTNWNYYGQYQNWNTSGQPQSTGSSGSTQAWAQYAQQYAQNNTANSSAQK